MPELPEVQSICTQLESVVSGQTVTSFTRFPKKIRKNTLPGKIRSPWTITAVERRAKYIILTGQDNILIIHLGMTGKLLLSPYPREEKHLVFRLTGTFGDLYFYDPRGFGVVDWIRTSDLDYYFSHLGPEPFDMDSKDFHSRLSRRKAAIKPTLMNQEIIVGVGNIYAAEALFRTGIAPTTPAQDLTRAQTDTLLTTIVNILSTAIKHHGTTFGSYVGITGEGGQYAQQLLVYNRPGLPCVSCGTPIEVIRQSGRSTFFCPKCQK